MADNEFLDQLWYTWSKDGLGSMSAGYRVRAASPGLYNLQDMRYRRLDRFLRYELPQGVNSSEFNNRIAPISFSFVDNGDEQLLIRKVFVGRDHAGRNQVFFTHLIAGLPREFTARDAIRLWYCPELWVESEDGKGSNDTTLPTIPYSRIRAYAEQSQTSFNFAPISEQLQNILLLILSQGLPPHIYVRGQSIFTAALIYGITHCLPMTLLKGLTFTTYESNANEAEATIVGTISGAELQDAITLQIQPAGPTRPASTDIHNYVLTAINCFLTGNMAKFTKLINEAEKHGHATTDDLVELFKRRFRISSLTPKQLEAFISHPNDNIEELLDPGLQRECAKLLLKQPEYWETRGKRVFNMVITRIDLATQTPVPQQTREAIMQFINALAEYVLAEMQAEILQETIPSHCVDVLTALAPPARNADIYQKMMTDFAQGQVYARITSDALWNFQVWLLQYAKLMQPLPTIQHVQPWLSIPTWGKLDQVLKLDLPTEWEQLAMFRRIERDIPKSAVQVVQAHEAKFKELLQQLLQQGSQLPKPEYTNMVVRFFAAMIEHDYPDRVPLLLFLLNTFPEPHFVDALFASVRFATPHQLVATEIESVLVGCRPEVIAAHGSSPALAEYIKEYILSLTPNKLSNKNVQKLLKQLSKEPLADRIADLVSHWLIIIAFQGRDVIERASLKQVRAALQRIAQERQPEVGNEQRQKLIAEMIPFLVKQVVTELDLANILEILGTFLVNSSWELLCWMAAIAGSVYTERLSKLTPYLLCGIREYARTGQSQSALDDYLQSLYHQVSENALRNIDTAISTGIFSELIQREWKGWRERGKTRWGANVPIVNKFTPQQQKPSTELEPNVSATSPAPLQAQQTRPLLRFQVPWGQINTGAQQEEANTQVGQINTLQAQARIVFLVHKREYEITVSKYQRLRHTLVQLLPYWSQILSDKLAKDRSKSIAFEVDTTASLLEELRRIPTTNLSVKLVEYLEDDVLIRLEVNRLHTEGNVSAAHFLSPEYYIPVQRSEFQVNVGDTVYRDLCQKYTEEGINKALEILIRRHHFIQHLDAQKKDWRKWLAKERKDAKVEQPKIIQR